MYLRNSLQGRFVATLDGLLQICRFCQHSWFLRWVRLCQVSALGDRKFRSQLLTVTAWLHVYTQKHTWWGKAEKQSSTKGVIYLVLCFPPAACELGWDSCLAGGFQGAGGSCRASSELGFRAWLLHRGGSVWGAELHWPHTMRKRGSQ